MESILASGFLGLILTIALFLLFRAIVLWYWKVDKVVALLESIDKKLGPEPGNGSIEKGKTVGANN